MWEFLNFFWYHLISFPSSKFYLFCSFAYPKGEKYFLSFFLLFWSLKILSVLFLWYIIKDLILSLILLSCITLSQRRRNTWICLLIFLFNLFLIFDKGGEIFEFAMLSMNGYFYIIAYFFYIGGENLFLMTCYIS